MATHTHMDESKNAYVYGLSREIEISRLNVALQMHNVFLFFCPENEEHDGQKKAFLKKIQNKTMPMHKTF